MVKFGFSTYRSSSNSLKNLKTKNSCYHYLKKNKINSDKFLKMISQNGSSGYWRCSGKTKDYLTKITKIRKVNKIKERQHDALPLTKWKTKDTVCT